MSSTWEDEYTNMLKLKNDTQNFNYNTGSFCKEKCRFKFNSKNVEKNLKVELLKEGSKNV